MAIWKKIIVSGSNAHLAEITSSILTNDNLVIAGVGGALESSGLTYDGSTFNIGSSVITSTGATSILSGSFSGSFEGDGSNLTGLVTSLDVSGSDGTGGSIDLLTQDFTITGANNEIETTISGQTLTIGLRDSITVPTASVLQNLTVGGNLQVDGDLTYLNTANLYVEDKFILLNSGSANPDEGGIIIDEGGAAGHAFVYDADAARFAFTSSLDSTATSVTPDAFVAAVVHEGSGHSDVAEYQKAGNIKIDSSDDIWIYV